MERRRICSGWLNLSLEVKSSQSGGFVFTQKKFRLVEVLALQGTNASLAYIYANEGDIYGNGSSAYSYVTVLDVRRQQASFHPLMHTCSCMLPSIPNDTILGVQICLMCRGSRALSSQCRPGQTCTPPCMHP